MTVTGPGAVDALILVLASAFSLFSAMYIATMWHMRRNFFIILRSPALSCTSGLGVTMRFMAAIYDMVLGLDDGIAHLVAFPALWIAQIALVMTAIRLFVMYYPSTRAKYGRITKERVFIRGLAVTYLFVETAVWSAAAVQGTQRVAAVMANLGPLSATITLVAAACIGRQLKRVNDFSNMGRDIRLVGTIMLVCLPVFVVIHLSPLSPVAFKYAYVGFISISHAPIVWIMTIRPFQEVLLHAGPKDMHNDMHIGVQMLLAISSRRRSSGRVGVAVYIEREPSLNGREAFSDANRLAGIMRFLPLREAFGEFCRKSLCGESFQFLLDVSEFRHEALDTAVHHGAFSGIEGTGDLREYGSVSAIVDTYIKDCSPSEINIDSKTKNDILERSRRQSYSLLDLDGRKRIFNAMRKKRCGRFWKRTSSTGSWRPRNTHGSSTVMAPCAANKPSERQYR